MDERSDFHPRLRGHVWPIERNPFGSSGRGPFSHGHYHHRRPWLDPIIELPPSDERRDNADDRWHPDDRRRRRSESHHEFDREEALEKSPADVRWYGCVEGYVD